MLEKPSPLSDSGADRTVFIERTFDAPRELVFDAWTNPKYLLRWFAPGSCSLRFVSIDVRRGGTFHSCISDPSFGECWCVGTYLELSRPERLVYTMAVADRHGNKVASSAAGHDEQWPPETTVVVTFEEVDGKTRLTLRQDVSETLARKTGAYPSWLSMLDRLNELLTNVEPMHA
jgi:uncharacterized protein YndB with AHSA1/START domain